MADRLDKIVAQGGLVTRKEAKERIKSGRVAVDGGICRDTQRHVAHGQEVTLDGAALTVGAVLLMMNKPAGVLTAARDRKDRTYQDLLPEKYARLALSAAGRLDKDAEGLLLLTNDGELVHRLISPRRHVEKLYTVKLDSPVRQEDVKAFASGLDLGDFVTLPARLRILPGDGTECEVAVMEGKFHQVKRMFSARGKKVKRLKRLEIGTLKLDNSLKSGEFRPLSAKEREDLYRLTELF